MIFMTADNSSAPSLSLSALISLRYCFISAIILIASHHHTLPLIRGFNRLNNLFFLLFLFDFIYHHFNCVLKQKKRWKRKKTLFSYLFSIPLIFIPHFHRHLFIHYGLPPFWPTFFFFVFLFSFFVYFFFILFYNLPFPCIFATISWVSPCYSLPHHLISIWPLPSGCPPPLPATIHSPPTIPVHLTQDVTDYS